VRSRNLHLYVLAALAVAVGYFAISQIGTPTSSGSTTTGRTETETVAAEDGVVQTSVTGSGNVAAGVDDDVDFATSGTLKHVYVHEGEHVKKGQILATLSPTAAQLTVDEAEANLTSAQDTLTTTEDGTTTTTTTTTSSATETAAEEADAAAALESDKVGVANDTATVTNDKLALTETTLRAPAAGTIVSLEDLEPGAEVSGSTSSDASSSSGTSSTGSADSDTSDAGSDDSTSSSSSTTFAEIVNTSTLTMSVSFSESDIGEIKIGQPATISMTALTDVELGAHVSAISSTSTDTDSVVSYAVTLTADQTDPQVLSGMSATAAVIVDQADGVTLPNDAVTGTGSDATLTVVTNGKDVSQPVVVGLRGTSRTVIVSGLKSGQDVLVTETIPSLGASSSETTTSSSSGTLAGGAAGAAGAAGAGGFGGGAGFAGRAGFGGTAGG
jgi:multidrug efflux pump subunit AcrA (membrane-fusion protein)